MRRRDQGFRFVVPFFGFVFSVAAMLAGVVGLAAQQVP
jgi:hypothetical protein